MIDWLPDITRRLHNGSLPLTVVHRCEIDPNVRYQSPCRQYLDDALAAPNMTSHHASSKMRSIGANVYSEYSNSHANHPPLLRLTVTQDTLASFVTKEATSAARFEVRHCPESGHASG